MRDVRLGVYTIAYLGITLAGSTGLKGMTYHSTELGLRETFLQQYQTQVVITQEACYFPHNANLRLMVQKKITAPPPITVSRQRNEAGECR